MIYNPQALLVGVLSVLLMTGGAYVKGRIDGKAIERADQAEVVAAIASAKEQAQKGAAEAISRIEVKNTTIRQTLEREIRETPIYSGCKHTPDGLQSINAALAGRAVAPGDRLVPKLDATR